MVLVYKLKAGNFRIWSSNCFQINQTCLGLKDHDKSDYSKIRTCWMVKKYSFTAVTNYAGRQLPPLHLALGRHPRKWSRTPTDIFIWPCYCLWTSYISLSPVGSIAITLNIAAFISNPIWRYSVYLLSQEMNLELNCIPEYMRPKEDYGDKIAYFQFLRFGTWNEMSSV
jgi:hypothetical protein